MQLMSSGISEARLIVPIGNPQDAEADQTSIPDETHLAWIVGRQLGARRPFEVIMMGVELADQLIELEGGFPNLEKQFTALASASDRALAIDGRIVFLMPAAAAFELSGSDLQRGG